MIEIVIEIRSAVDLEVVFSSRDGGLVGAWWI